MDVAFDASDRKQLHPFFHEKAVVEICCAYCNQKLSNRGMQAFLLADTKVNLFSTDIAPKRLAFFYIYLCCCRSVD